VECLIQGKLRQDSSALYINNIERYITNIEQILQLASVKYRALYNNIEQILQLASVMQQSHCQGMMFLQRATSLTSHFYYIVSGEDVYSKEIKCEK